MKTKSHSKWAMALCAVAFFSFTTAGFAKSRASFAGILDQGKQPASVSDGSTVQPGSEVLPPAPSSDAGGTVSSGTYTGTVLVD